MEEIFLNGLFAMAEIAVISARKSSLQSDAGKGSKSAKKALKLAENPDRFLSSVQVGITLIGLLTGNRIIKDMAGKINWLKQSSPHVMSSRVETSVGRFLHPLRSVEMKGLSYPE